MCITSGGPVAGNKVCHTVLIIESAITVNTSEARLFPVGTEFIRLINKTVWNNWKKNLEFGNTFLSLSK